MDRWMILQIARIITDPWVELLWTSHTQILRNIQSINHPICKTECNFAFMTSGIDPFPISRCLLRSHVKACSGLCVLRGSTTTAAGQNANFEIPGSDGSFGHLNRRSRGYFSKIASELDSKHWTKLKSLKMLRQFETYDWAAIFKWYEVTHHKTNKLLKPVSVQCPIPVAMGNNSQQITSQVPRRRRDWL